MVAIGPFGIARAHLHHHRRIGAHHLLRVDDGLGHAGRARGEQQLADGIGRDLRNRLLDRFRHRRCGEIGKGHALDALAGPQHMNDGDAGEIERLQRLLEGRPVLHHHDRRLDQVEEIFELEMILAHQRIGRRHRRGRQARLHRGLRHQRVLDRIAGQDRDGTAFGEAEIEQALRQPVDDALGFAVGDFAPLPVGAAALRQPDALGRLLRPFRKRSRNMLLVRLQRNARLQDDDAIRTTLDRDVARQPFDLAKGRLGQHCGCTPTHIASPGIQSFADLVVIA